MNETFLNRTLVAFWELRQAVLDAAGESPRYATSQCPLREWPDGHYQASQMLAGLGVDNWHCPFCGEKDSV